MDFALQRLAALFVLDSEQRLLAVNEPEPAEAAPALYLMRTPERVLCAARHDVDTSVAGQLQALAETEPVGAAFSDPLRHHDDYLGLLESISPVDEVESGPVFHLPPTSPTHKTVMIDETNRHLLLPHFSVTADLLDFRAPVAAVVQDGMVVAACYCARRTADVAEAGVYTLEDYRQRGYAGMVVNDWSAAVSGLGIQPIYSTSWDNRTSQGVARKLGGVMVATDFSFYF